MKIIIKSFIIILSSLSLCAQDTKPDNSDVYLKVVNQRGSPVRNIVVHSLNTNTTGMTDRNGLFKFENIPTNDSISVILSRFGQTIIPVSGMDSIVVTLRSASLYSYTDNFGQSVYIEKIDNTSPNTVIDVPKMLENNRYTSLIDLLQGSVAGLNIVTVGGANTAIVRGQRSFNNSNEPLVVINGRAYGTLNEANSFINVNDVRTIEVQKGANEWGSRGAGGVIQIITK